VAPVSGRTFVFLIAFMAGCSLDFTVRPEPSDAGSPLDASDASDADPPGDAASDVTIADASADADAAVDCTALAVEVDQKRKATRTCTLASGHCQSTVKNQCGCDVVVAVAGSGSVIAYEDAVTRLKSSGCALGCGDGGCPSPTPRNCLQQNTDVLCFPE
jgi:hypothetical protein